MDDIIADQTHCFYLMPAGPVQDPVDPVPAQPPFQESALPTTNGEAARDSFLQPAIWVGTPGPLLAGRAALLTEPDRAGQRHASSSSSCPPAW